MYNKYLQQVYYISPEGSRGSSERSDWTEIKKNIRHGELQIIVFSFISNNNKTL